MSKKQPQIYLLSIKDALINLLYHYDLPAEDKEFLEVIDRFIKDVDSIIYSK